MPTLHTVLAAYPIWLPVLVVLLASLATRLTAYPRAAGVVTGIRVVLDVLSIWQHRDSPGSGWQLPIVQRSNPPEGAALPVGATVPPGPGLWLVGLLSSCLLGCDAIDAPSGVGTVVGLGWLVGGVLAALSLRSLWRWYHRMRVWAWWALVLALVPSIALADIVKRPDQTQIGLVEVLGLVAVAVCFVVAAMLVCDVLPFFAVRFFRWLARRRGVAAVLLLLLAASAPGCGATTKQIAATATIATVQTLDEGIAQFTAWASSEEDGIAEAAVRACSGKATRPDYNACTSAIVTPRRAPIDKAKAAIRLYRAALAGGDKLAQGDLAITGQSVIEALAAVGIQLVAGGAR